MKPFLLLSIRGDDAAADDEYAGFLRVSGLDEPELRRVRLDQDPLGEVTLDDWSGVLLGGGPFNTSDPGKSTVQQRVESELAALLDQLVPRDFPFLGACFGIGVLGSHRGGSVDRSFPEGVGPLEVALTDEGVEDPLFGGVPAHFTAYGGHKEAMSRLPDDAVLLATSAACPVQAFRIGRNVYATQFHPELDLAGICTRIEVYRHAGYFEPHQAEVIQQRAAEIEVSHPGTLLRNFVTRHAR